LAQDRVSYRSADLLIQAGNSVLDHRPTRFAAVL